MADLEYIRQRCRDLPIPELFREVLVHGGDYVPAAQDAMREELERRVGDIRAYVGREKRSTGDELLRLEGVENFGRTMDRFVGALVFTAGGFGFVARDRERGEVPHVGLAALIHTIIQGELEKRTDVAAASHQAIPLSLLAEIHDGAFWWSARSECAVELDGRVFRVRAPDEKNTVGIIRESDGPAIEAWGTKTGVPVTRRVHEPLSKKLGRWFGRKDA